MISLARILTFLFCQCKRTNIHLFSSYQIQFKEKVLWTAITLFIFLVCCQVRQSVIVLIDYQ